MPDHPSAASPRARHIVLVGLPGAGKSTVGRAAAPRLGRPFLDFDEEIERRTAMSVAELFARWGEPRFRALERELTRELLHAPPMVLAPGGGWIANADMVALLRPSARIIYLRLRPETALARLGDAALSRPLLRVSDPLAELRRLLDRRAAHYLAADHVLDVDLIGVQEVTDLVVRVAGSPGAD
ncbi:MAG TPA: shikimate kinase [Gemmatimonadaceae bacterium]|nr:shikimate kinase [Gemmatimonadaceae bacterium]